MNELLVELQDVVVLRHTDPSGLFGLWGAKPVRALDGVSLAIRRGETVGIMGGSGSGKTTLAETVALRRSHDRGRVLLMGQDAAKIRGGERRKAQRRLQIIRQDARESLDMERTVRKQLQDELRQMGLPDAENRLAMALARVELPPSEFLDRTPREMSGGQQQRVAIARALMMNPLLIAADEPVSGVDERLQGELLQLLRRVQQEQNLAVLLISQNPRTIRALAHRVGIMHAGRLYELGPAERVFAEAAHPYSRLFLDLEEGGLPPEEDLAGKVQRGCPWAPHCSRVIERCRTERPAHREVGEAHTASCHALLQGGA